MPKKLADLNNLNLWLLLILPAQLFCDNAAAAENHCFTGAFTSGYVFKRDDCIFKEVYGHGMINVITADGCYYPWETWGVGAKLSYWLAHGHTTFLKLPTTAKEVPLTIYLRKRVDFKCGLQTYASLGGGIVWLKEHSYLGDITDHKWIGEVEAGLHYPIWRSLNFTTALRYLFPKQSQCQVSSGLCSGSGSGSGLASGSGGSGPKINVGGYDLRAGIEFSF